MSQPKRYYLDDYGVLIEHPNGEYLLHSDYAALAAENANLKALQWETLKERNKAEAEVEWLRKADRLVCWNPTTEQWEVRHEALK